MENRQEYPEIVLFLWKWKKAFLLAIAISVLAGIIISSPWVIPSLYESRVVMFATSSNSIDKSIDDQFFGYDVDADRLLQVLESESLRDSVIKRFGLVSHYAIDTNARAWKYDLHSTFSDNINFERTRYMSVIIKVRDEDPQKAADIANGIAVLVDEIRNKVLKRNAEASMLAAQQEYYAKLEMVETFQKLVDSLKFGNKSQVLHLQGTHYRTKTGSIADLRKQLNELRVQYNIFDYGYQVNVLNEALAEAKSKFLNESGKFSIYNDLYSKQDTIWINTKARMEGARKEVEQLEDDLSRLAQINKHYLSLTDKLAIEVHLSAQAQHEYEKSLTSFEPEFMNTELQKMNTLYASELFMLGELRKKYDRAYQNFHKPLPATYKMNLAQAADKKVYPLRWVVLLISVISGIALTFILLLAGEKTVEFNEYLRRNKTF